MKFRISLVVMLFSGSCTATLDAGIADRIANRITSRTAEAIADGVVQTMSDVLWAIPDTIMNPRTVDVESDLFRGRFVFREDGRLGEFLYKANEENGNPPASPVFKFSKHGKNSRGRQSVTLRLNSSQETEEANDRPIPKRRIRRLFCR